MESRLELELPFAAGIAEDLQPDRQPKIVQFAREEDGVARANMAVARAKTAEMSKETLGNHLLRGLNLDAATFCSSPARKAEIGPEWYLRGRQFLFKGSREFF